MKIRIEGYDLPGSSCGPSPQSPGGHHGIHVAVQRRGRPDELLGLTPASAPAAQWTIDGDVAGSPDAPDIKGRYIQGPPGARIIYLSWGPVDEAAHSRCSGARSSAWTPFRRRLSPTPRGSACSSAASASPTPEASRCARRFARR
jgi:hypothetical protein